jgi:hypothetical protein
MGHCKDGMERCWRRWRMSYLPERSIVKVGNYCEYEALSDCRKKRPPIAAGWLGAIVRRTIAP